MQNNGQSCRKLGECVRAINTINSRTLFICFYDTRLPSTKPVWHRVRHRHSTQLHSQSRAQLQLHFDQNYTFGGIFRIKRIYKLSRDCVKKTSPGGAGIGWLVCGISRRSLEPTNSEPTAMTSASTLATCGTRFVDCRLLSWQFFLTC